MGVRVEGCITVDVSDYSDDIQFYADCEDIFELMENNNITAGEMIEFLREEEYPLDIHQIYDWLDQQDINTICAVSKTCIDKLRHEYNEAEEGRLVYRKKVKELESEENVLRGASPMHN